MELIREASIPTLSNSGVESRQLLFPENSASERITITRVMMPPEITNPLHNHTSSEQVWVALEGEGTLLLAGGETVPFRAGDLARFSEGEMHGFTNTGEVPFVYISVTSPPINFRGVYSKIWESGSGSTRI
jgi:mannose-6-phosphate isomerase-like protein (cupin superfamily)